MTRFFPAGDTFWAAVLAFLCRHATAADRILAPKEFLEELPGVFGYGIQYAFPLHFFSLVVLHKGMYDYFPISVLEELRASYVPCFANEVFVVFAGRSREGASYVPDVHYEAFAVALEQHRRQGSREEDQGDAAAAGMCGVVVTTFNRPQALSRSLPQICRAGAPVLVVDDGTTGEGGSRNRGTAAACGADYLLLPGNRGLPAAINAGVSFWLADPRVRWISCFQDDVDVHPDIFSHLGKVQDPATRPILTGRFSSRHPTYGREFVNGAEIILMRGISGQHIHAHRDYWQGVLPVPAPYLGAPKPGGGLAGQGPEEDFWISAWSPVSITKKGGFVACLPGLVRVFLTSAEDSTWGRDLGEEDGQLRETSAWLARPTEMSAAPEGLRRGHGPGTSKKVDRGALENWRIIPWIKDYAEFFNISVEDVKLVFEVFLGDRVKIWSHPFGDVADWADQWNDEKNIAIRQAIIQERGWSWDSVGAKVLQNEIYRRIPWAVSEHRHLRDVISGCRQQLGRDIRLLDYGCGTANFVGHIVDVPGVWSDLWETDPIVLGYCSYKFRNNPSVQSCKVIPSPQTFSGDACRIATLPIEFGRSYDVIYTMDVLEHTLDPLRVLMNLVTHLNPGGLLLFNYPDYIEGDWHTPEAHYLRPFCLFYVHLLFTQEDTTVFRKTCSPLIEGKVNKLARVFATIGEPFVRKRARKYLGKSSYAKKYHLD